jgi:hypothetical protein
MLSRVRHWLIFRLEQMVMRGALARLGIILGLIVGVALIAGLLVRAVAPGFESAGEAVWWAFLRLTDPGYLGEDVGVARASIATAVTVLGYILFMGALIAILVQWLDRSLNRLERGLTPVALNDHVVLLGWSSRTPGVLEEILASQARVERFLRSHGARQLRVAVLAEQAGADLIGQLRHQLGERWSPRQIILRSGSPLELDALVRIDFAHAAAIVIPAADTIAGSALDADARSVKTLMTMAAALAEDASSGTRRQAAEELPLMVLELQDTCYARWLRALYPGPMEIIGGDDVLVQLMVQSVRNPGLSHVYEEILSDQRGSQIYVRQEPALVGCSIRQLAYAFPEGVLLGLVRPNGSGFQALLNPPNHLRVEPGDRVVVLATSYSEASPPDSPATEEPLAERQPPSIPAPRRRRVLVLGWNHLLPALMKEFASQPGETFAIDIVSEVSASKRRKRLNAEEMPAGRIEISHHEFDDTVPAYLAGIDPSSYDNVLLLRSERLRKSAESDSRTILAYLLLREVTAHTAGPNVLMELTDDDNSRLFENRLENEHTEIVVTSRIVSHILARVALRRELRCVFDELFRPGGCDIGFRRLADYDLAPGRYRFADLQKVVDARDNIAIGVRRQQCRRDKHGGVLINPGRDQALELGAEDELILLFNPD